MEYKPIALIDIGQSRDDVYTAARKHNMEVENIYNILNEGTSGSGTGSGGQGTLSFKTMEELTGNGVTNLSEGTEFKLLGYYVANDGGGADYVCTYLWSQSAYPWAIDLGATEDLEYELVYKKDGTPEIDSTTGEYVKKVDTSGQPIPVYADDGVTVKHKHLYAVITDTTVNYRQFGAKLDGETDDEKALRMCHRYQHDTYTIEPLTGRKHFFIRVENHSGIIRKDNADPIICSGDIDLSGSQLLVKDDNAAWFGFYLWGDNEEDYQVYEPVKDTTDTFVKDNFVINTKGNDTTLYPNSLLFLKEDPYAVRDDGGYLYSEPRYELLLHTTDGILTSPFTYDWNNPGGLEINSPVSDYNTHEVSTQTVNSHFSCNYTRLPATHYHFIGCDVNLKTTANKYCSVLWCKCHNAHISGFNFTPDSDQMHNTQFKNTMVYIWGCYNVEVSNIVGFNAAGKKSGGSNATSGYVIRATNCLQLRLHDISVQGYWGATAMNCVKDIHIYRVSINRLDIHNYFYNLYIDHCNLFNHAIQIGEGRGIVQVTNSNFYVNKLDADSYPNAHILEFNLTYGRIFEGKVLIQNCNAYLKDPDGKEFDVCKIEFSPEAVSTLDSYRFPEVTIKDCYFHSYNSDTYLVYFMIAGKRNCTTSTKGPSVLIDYSRDLGNDGKGTLEWKYIGRGIDWTDDGDTGKLHVKIGQIIRVYKKYLDSDQKTAFYDFHYFLVTQDGDVPTPSDDNAPTDYSGSEFVLGTAKAKCVTHNKWEAARAYSTGDYCFTESSSWLPVYCYQCTNDGTSNGWRPTHLSGKVIEGEDVYPKNLDACYWQYVGTADKFVTKNFTASMTIEANDILYADHRLYKVIKGGKLNEVPPLNTAWLSSFVEGTATLSFIGKEWAPVTWWSRDAYCLSYGSDNILQVYQLVDQDGTTSGSIPVPGNGRCIDGDIIWQNTTDAATKEWAAQTQFYEGDIVSYNANNYKCVFDGRLELPTQINLENISTNMKEAGDVFAFWDGGTDVPTKVNSTGKWTIKIDNVETYQFRTFTNGYFGHEGNPQPVILERGKDSGSGGSSGMVPTKTSELTNDSGFITAADVPTIPTKTSELTNDSKFVTADSIPDVPTKTSELTNDSEFITAADVPTIPTKTSELTNDSEFITQDALTATEDSAGTSATKAAQSATDAATSATNAAASAIEAKDAADKAAGVSGGDFLTNSEVVTVATANKVLRLNADAKLPADIEGTADKAIADEEGNSILTTYAKKSDIPDTSGFITADAIPDVPTKTSELTNDSKFITAADVPTIPTKTSELTNDSEFVTVETAASTYATKEDIDTAIASITDGDEVSY